MHTMLFSLPSCRHDCLKPKKMPSERLHQERTVLTRGSSPVTLGSGSRLDSMAVDVTTSTAVAPPSRATGTWQPKVDPLQKSDLSSDEQSRI